MGRGHYRCQGKTIGVHGGCQEGWASVKRGVHLQALANSQHQVVDGFRLHQDGFTSCMN